jgi:hypothetical protein
MNRKGAVKKNIMRSIILLLLFYFPISLLFSSCGNSPKIYTFENSVFSIKYYEREFRYELYYKKKLIDFNAIAGVDKDAQYKIYDITDSIIINGDRAFICEVDFGHGNYLLAHINNKELKVTTLLKEINREHYFLNEIYKDSIAVFKGYWGVVLMNLNTLKQDSLFTFEKNHSSTGGSGGWDGGGGDTQMTLADYGFFDSENKVYASINYSPGNDGSIIYWDIKLQEKNKRIIHQFRLNNLNKPLPDFRPQINIDRKYGGNNGEKIIHEFLQWKVGNNGKPTLKIINNTVLISADTTYAASSNNDFILISK